MPDELQDIKGVGESTAESLRDDGYRSFEKIAVTSPKELAEKTSLGETKAKKVIRRAKDKCDVGGFESASDIYDRRKNIGKISLLDDSIDRLFGDVGEGMNSGVQTQAITEFYGKFGSGKSQITHQLCVNVQLPKEVGGLHGRPLFIDTEDSFRPGRIDDMVRGLPDEVLDIAMEEDNVNDVDDLVGKMVDRIMVSTAENSDHQLLLGEQVEDAASDYEEDDYPVRLLVVDSVMGNLRPEYQGRGELGLRQRKLNKHISDLMGFSKLHNAAVVLANQIVSNPNSQWGPSDKPVGGNILGHNSTYRVKISNAGKDKRKLKMVDAPDLPKREVVLRVKEEGLKPE